MDNALTIEKQWQHTKFVRETKSLTKEQAIDLLIDLHKLYLGQQQVFSDLLKAPHLD